MSSVRCSDARALECQYSRTTRLWIVLNFLHRFNKALSSKSIRHFTESTLLKFCSGSALNMEVEWWQKVRTLFRIRCQLIYVTVVRPAMCPFRHKYFSQKLHMIVDWNLFNNCTAVCEGTDYLHIWQVMAVLNIFLPKVLKFFPFKIYIIKIFDDSITMRGANTYIKKI